MTSIGTLLNYAGAGAAIPDDERGHVPGEPASSTTTGSGQGSGGLARGHGYGCGSGFRDCGYGYGFSIYSMTDNDGGGP